MTSQPNTSFEPLFNSESPLFAQAVHSSLMILIAKIIRYTFVFVSQIILMNFLNPGDFGLMRFVTIVLGIANLLSEAGLGVAIVQKKSLKPDEIAASFFLIILLSMGLYGAIFISAPSIALFFNNAKLIDLIRIGGLSAPIGGLSVVQRGLMQRKFLYGRLSLIETISAVSGSIIGMLLAYFGYGVWALIGSVLLYNVLSTALSLLIGGWTKGNYKDLRSSVTLWLFGLGTVVQRIIDFGSSNLDYIVIGKYFGEMALGIYGMAFVVITLPQYALGVVLGSVAMSAFSRFQEDNERLSAAFIRLTRVTTALSIPYFVLIFALAPELMQAVAFIHPSAKWVPAAPYIKILAPVGLLYCLSSYPGIVWITKGLTRFRIQWALFSFITLALTIGFGSIYGVSGICKALLLRAIALFPISLIINKRTFGLSPLSYLTAIIPSLCCGFASYIALWCAEAAGIFKPGTHIFTTIAGESALCLTVYIATLRIVSENAYKDLSSVISQMVKKR
jgi:O-antigen/teichoic acid export membrane protein